MAKRHDLARPLLQANIQHVPTTNAMWGKSVWALARMENLFDQAESARLYRLFSEEDSIPVRFRLQAQLLWCQALIAAGEPGPLLEARSLMETTLGNIQDPDVLMNFARQLQLGPAELKVWALEIFSRGEALALEQFNVATHPSAAISILFKLTRRQVMDFGRSRESLILWESFNAEKRDWLWSQSATFWEYMGLLFYAYISAGASGTGEGFAQALLDDPATPAEGLVCVGIPYGQWLIQKRRVQDAQNLFSILIKASPNHPLCAYAHYWKALKAYKLADIKTMEKHIECIRRAQGNSLGVLDKWDLDAKALLLFAGLNVDKVALQIRSYNPKRLHFLRAEITRELGVLS
jgi:tetratricopeptide (TPR) repeat protein